MSWTPLTFVFGSLLTSTKLTQLFDDIGAAVQQNSGAPLMKAPQTVGDISLTTSAAAWTQYAQTLIYIPPMCNTLAYYGYGYADSVPGNERATLRLSHDGVNGSGIITASGVTSPTLVQSWGGLDVSSISGWHEFEVEGYNTGSTKNAANCAATVLDLT